MSKDKAFIPEYKKEIIKLVTEQGKKSKRYNYCHRSY